MTPDTQLVRAPGVTIELGDADDVRILRVARAARVHAARPCHLARVRPASHDRGVLACIAGGKQHFIEFASTIVQLATAGVLRVPGLLESAPRGYASPTMHVVMLDDEPRTRGYMEAIEAVVRAGDVVVDIGTGTGVLATVAPRTGAARVHAIESSAIADADVLMTEMIGNDPLDEHLLELVADAKSRLLRSGARLVPSAIEIFAQPVDLPRRLVERHLFTPERLAAWQRTDGRVPRVASRGRSRKSGSDRSLWPIRRRVADAGDVHADARRRAARHRPHVPRDAGAGCHPLHLAEEVHPTNRWRYALWPARGQAAFAADDTATIDYACDRGVTSLGVRPTSIRTEAMDPSSGV